MEFDEHADGDDVVDLAEFLLTAEHLLVDAVRVLGAAGDGCVHAEGRELASQDLGDVAHECVALLARAREASLDQVIVVGIDLYEREILELALDLPDPEAMRERRVDVQRLAADAQPALGGMRVDRAHVVQPIAELDEHDTHILGHRHEHFPDVFRLMLLGATHVDLAELGDPVDELRDLVAEEDTHILTGHFGVLDGVVEERRHERFGVEAKVGEDAGHREGMLDVRLAGQPGLPRMGAIGDFEGALDRGLILRREVVDASHELSDRHGLYECRTRAALSNTM